jgi:F-type H+-transporting ATPase subunit gamma
MATLREIKRRITSIKNTEKITRAMKMVAAVKFRKAQENVVSARPYARKIAEILRNLIPTVEHLQNELLMERDVNKICMVVVTADRGLAGSFNTNLIKEAQSLITAKYNGYYSSHDLTLICVGKKSYDYFFKRHFDIYAKYTGVFDRLEFNSARKIVSEIIKGYAEKKFDKVVLVYNEFKSVIQSRIIEEQFLPVQTLTPEGSASGNVSNFIYEPSAKEIIAYMLPKHLNTQIWRVLLESYASEQAARMTAMDSATRNANDLISSLQLYYNKARQSAITKELLEIVAGADALKEAG